MHNVVNNTVWLKHHHFLLSVNFWCQLKLPVSAFPHNQLGSYFYILQIQSYREKKRRPTPSSSGESVWVCHPYYKASYKHRQSAQLWVHTRSNRLLLLGSYHKSMQIQVCWLAGSSPSASAYHFCKLYLKGNQFFLISIMFSWEAFLTFIYAITCEI